MELSIEYVFLIASCCYLWIMVALYFSYIMNSISDLGRNEPYYIVTILSLTLAFLLQAIFWLLKALPIDLSMGSTLAFEQGVTFLILIFVMSMSFNMYDKNYNDEKYAGAAAINLFCIVLMGLVENILSYYLVETDNSGVRISCYVFSVIVWIFMIPLLFYNLTYIRNIT